MMLREEDDNQPYFQQAQITVMKIINIGDDSSYDDDDDDNQFPFIKCNHTYHNKTKASVQEQAGMM